MIESGYDHPITFTPTGDLRRDFAHAYEDYEHNVRSLLPADVDQPILEIGCGWGQFLAWLRDRGHTAVTGIDVGARQVAFCRALGLNVVEVEDTRLFLEARPAQYEMVALHHVIEHMPPLIGVAVLRSVRASLRPGGRVVIQTPNMSAATANIARHIEISHETGYTESSLAQILTLAGFGEIHVFGSRTAMTMRPRRIAWLALQLVARTLWRTLLVAELGTDAPRWLEKNIYATGLNSEMAQPVSANDRKGD